jgi:hypothetical protein
MPDAGFLKRLTSGAWIPAALLVFFSYLFRVPRLINPCALHSDAAIVGLQARHILQGEWSPLLHGSTYQSSVDSLVAALWFAVLGAGPLQLILSTLTNHVILTLCAFDMLRRRLPPWSALVCSLPLVFTPSAVHTYVLSPPRQAALTLTFVALWLVDGAAGLRTERMRLALAGATAAFAVFADPFALLSLPLVVVFGWMTCHRPDARSLLRAGWFTGGVLAGFLPYLLLLRSPGHDSFYAGFSTSTLAHNADLLWHQCLPWLLGLKVYLVHPDRPRDPWVPGFPFRAIQIAGVALVSAAFGWSALLSLRLRVAPPTARLGLLGIAAVPASVLAFLFSKMVLDLFATRYLVDIILFAPFALAPPAARLGARKLALVTLPYLLTAAVGGWLAFGDEVAGPLPVRSPDGAAIDEMRLTDALVARGATVGIADYWTAYRFVFLASERVVLVPWHRHQDRYPAYRQRLLRAHRFAYVHDESRSWENFESSRRELEARAREVDRVDVGKLHAVIYEGSLPDGF